MKRDDERNGEPMTNEHVEKRLDRMGQHEREILAAARAMAPVPGEDRIAALVHQRLAGPRRPRLPVWIAAAALVAVAFVWAISGGSGSGGDHPQATHPQTAPRDQLLSQDGYWPVTTAPDATVHDLTTHGFQWPEDANTRVRIDLYAGDDIEPWDSKTITGKQWIPTAEFEKEMRARSHRWIWVVNVLGEADEFGIPSVVRASGRLQFWFSH
jgi:hypothetical protein